MSPIALVKGFLPSFMRNAERGSMVVNILSVAGLVGTPVRTFYSTSKFALDGFGKALAPEVKGYNVHVL